jgi:hypothetical protein
MPLVNGITQADIEMLVAENSLVAEQHDSVDIASAFE